MAHDALRNAYDLLKFIKVTCQELGEPVEIMGALIREQRRTIHRINQYSSDPLARSLRDEWRHGFSEDGESGYDYRIIPDNGQTEEEIEDQVCCEVGYPPIYSPYDCTGKRFTRWIKVRRAPAGFAVIHGWGLDV